MRLIAIMFTVTLALIAFKSAYAGLDQSCFKSFKIEKGKTVQYKNQTLSCEGMETIKNNTFNIFNDKDYEYLLKNLKEAKKNLENLEKKLEDQTYTSENALFAVSTIGFAAGLISCPFTAGVGCGVAAEISLGASLIGKFASLASYSSKLDIIHDLKAKIVAQEANLIRHESEFPLHYDKAIKNFNQMCKIIIEKCL